jgi:hypothetical protein
MSDVKNKAVYVYEPTTGPAITIEYDGTDADLADKLEAENVALVAKLAAAKIKNAHALAPDPSAKLYDPTSPMPQEQIEAEAIKFQNATPEYQGSAAQFAALAQYMSRFNLAPTAENWRMAFDALTELKLITKAKPTSPVDNTISGPSAFAQDGSPANKVFALINVTVEAGVEIVPDFTIELSPTTLDISTTGTASVSVSQAALNDLGFSDIVLYGVAYPPSLALALHLGRLSWRQSASYIEGAGTLTITFTTSGLAAGSYTFYIYGQSTNSKAPTGFLFENVAPYTGQIECTTALVLVVS